MIILKPKTIDALAFANDALRDQVRAGRGSFPAITHSISLAEKTEWRASNVLFQDESCDPPLKYPISRIEMTIIAILHDVVEDGRDGRIVTVLKMREMFGEEITNHVLSLTAPLKEDFPHKTHEELREMYNKQIATSPVQIQILKCFDILLNSYTMESAKPKYAPKWALRRLKTVLAMSNDVPAETKKEVSERLLEIIYEKIEDSNE